MTRSYYSDSITNFLCTEEINILGHLAERNEFPLEQTQRDAWLEEITILRSALDSTQGHIYLEYSIPRMGQRIDAVLLIGPVIFVLEFKIGEADFASYAIDQVWDYALDLKNFHEPSHNRLVVPILIATEAKNVDPAVTVALTHDKLVPIKSSPEQLRYVLEQVLDIADIGDIDQRAWECGRYCPTPTIIEAALALYRGHSVCEISRNDANATNLSRTSESISSIIRNAQLKSHKAVCFVTGVPGAGKTLVGLNLATTHIKKDSKLYSVFLSGNGPLVAVLREALARDKVQRERRAGRNLKKIEAMSEVKAFIQNVHHFRDDCLVDPDSPPIEHVALFDEAQRAWNTAQTSSFMRRKKKIANFSQSEPEFLISCLDRHTDWAVIVCLVGGGQEINTGEAGITEWIEALIRSFPDWRIYIPSRLADTEYGGGEALSALANRPNVVHDDELHLSVSMRSFRAEHLSLLVKQLLDVESQKAHETLQSLKNKYPIVITRDLASAKCWLRKRAGGSERYGIVASSEAQRLKPYAIDVKTPVDPVHWFLDSKGDVRSSYYLEDVATEFHVQGLELDWCCVTWDADFRYSESGWEHWSFCGDRWKHIRNHAKQMYLKNAYRVLLTRARQGMVIVVPPGNFEDKTRDPAYYDPTFKYLKRIGFPVI